jgi:hypothetical protein
MGDDGEDDDEDALSTAHFSEGLMRFVRGSRPSCCSPRV